MHRQSLLTTIAIVTVTVLALLAALDSRRAQAQETPTAPSSVPMRTVSVSGLGEVRATPDIVTISLGVRSDAKSSAEALEANSSQMAALIATLKSAGVAAKDIQTTNFSIWPQYSSSSSDTRITGYEVSNQVTITVRNLDNFGAVLDAAVKAGGNQVSDIRFGFSTPQALMDQAREAAMADAKRKAAQLAALAEAELGAVVTISESGASVPMPVPLMMDTAADSSAVPIESGESAISSRVSVTYELRIP